MYISSSTVTPFTYRWLLKKQKPEYTICWPWLQANYRTGLQHQKSHAVQALFSIETLGIISLINLFHTLNHLLLWVNSSFLETNRSHVQKRGLPFSLNLDRTFVWHSPSAIKDNKGNYLKTWCIIHLNQWLAMTKMCLHCYMPSIWAVSLSVSTRGFSIVHRNEAPENT